MEVAPTTGAVGAQGRGVAQDGFGSITGLMHCSKRHLLDHLIGGDKQRMRNGAPKRLGRLEVDYLLEAGRLLDWEVRGVCTAQDSIGIAGGLSEKVGKILPIRSWRRREPTGSPDAPPKSSHDKFQVWPRLQPEAAATIFWVNRLPAGLRTRQAR
jgi:hypothetical protein